MKLRVLFYLSLVVLLAIGVTLKIGVIEEKRNAPTLSILKEWAREGKPVEVTAAEKGEIVLLERTTAEIASKGQAVAQISRSLQPKLRAGDKVYIMAGEETVAGQVTSVARVASRLTGLFEVRIKPLKLFEDNQVGQSAIVDVVVSKIENVLKLPLKAVNPTKEGGQSVWKLDGEKVSLVAVETGRSSAEFVEIVSGLASGDEVVVRGGSQLEEGENVRVVSSSLSMSRGGE